MAICPVCEHVQETGDACDVCDHQLVAAARVSAPIGGLEGLEQTLWEEPFPEDPPAMQELEQTSLPDAGAVAAERVQDLERTAAEPVEAKPEVLPEMDSGRAEDADPRTAASPDGPYQCRYCRAIQATGTFCDRCGMRLPRVAVALAGKARKGAAEKVMCSRCSERVVAGTRCQACGQLAPGPAFG